MFNLRNIVKEEIEKLSFEKLKQFHGDFFEYNIKKNGEKIGTISVELKNDMLKIGTIVIDDKFRGQGFGTNSLKQIVLKLKDKLNFKFIEYYAVSEASGRTAIKSFGNPVIVDTIYHEYNSFDEALKGFTLPKTARVKDGAIMHGEMDSIRLVFEV